MPNHFFHRCAPTLLYIFASHFKINKFFKFTLSNERGKRRREKEDMEYIRNFLFIASQGICCKMARKIASQTVGGTYFIQPISFGESVGDSLFLYTILSMENFNTHIN